MSFLKLRNLWPTHKENKFFIFSFNLLLTGIYFLVSIASLKFATINSSVTPIWPSTGLAISILILFGRRYIWSIFAGALLANALTSPVFLNALSIAGGNSLEAIFGYLIFERLKIYKNRFEYLTDLITIGMASFIAPIISATVGVCSLRFFGLISSEIQYQVWATWWSADVIGALLVIPLLLSFGRFEFVKFYLNFKLNFKKQFIYTLISIIPLVVFYFIVSRTTSLKFLFLFFPLITLITFNKNKFVMHLFSLILCAEALWITGIGKGPFNVSTLNQNLLNLEIFLSAIAITMLVLANLNRFRFIGQVRILLMSGWLFWGGVFYFIQLDRDNVDKSEFKITTSDLENRMKEKMRDYLQVLASGRALFKASKNVENEEWRAFVNSLNLSMTYEGMNGMGAVYKVYSKDLNSHLNEAKKTIDPNFSFKRVPLHLGDKSVFADDHFIITFIEPYEKNAAARGLDLGSESNRRNAAERAIISGNATLTDRIRLIQDKNQRFGFLVYLPVYKSNLPITTTKERIKAFSHWIYAPFITELFLDSIFSKFKNDQVSFKLYDRAEPSEENLVYSFHANNKNMSGFQTLNTINLGDKVFYAEWSQTSKYMASNNFLSTWIGLIGTVMVLIVVLFIINVQNLEEKSKKIAKILHQDFIESQLVVKEQEARMIESRKMATLGEMASSIAHEINNPLAIIAGNNVLIKRSLNEPSNEIDITKLLKNVEKIEKTVNRVDKIIKGLRLFSRDGSLDQMSSASIDSLIEETLSLCQERFRTTGVLLSFETNYHGDILCRGTQISQVLINLLNNAYDAVAELDEKWVHLKIQQVQNELIISVIDSGFGVPVEIQNKILQPFFTTKELGRGTGLGLSISKGIIESHGGGLTIQTLKGHTCFVVKLPINQKAA